MAISNETRTAMRAFAHQVRELLPHDAHSMLASELVDGLHDLLVCVLVDHENERRAQREPIKVPWRESRADDE